MKTLQEEFREAAEDYVRWQYPMGVEKEYPIADFTAGVIWQQERSYSEQDLRNAFRAGMNNVDCNQNIGLFCVSTEEEWFEKFEKSQKIK